MGTPNSYGYDTPPPRSSSGTNIVLIVLGIVFGVLLLIVVSCGLMGFLATRTITQMAGELQDVMLQAMANDAVQKYQDHDLVQEHIGEIGDYSFQDVKGFEAMNKPILRLRVTGDKSQGTIVFHRRNNRLQRVTLEVDGQEFLLDDKPTELFQQDFSDYEMDKAFKSDQAGDEMSVKTDEGSLNPVD